MKIIVLKEGDFSVNKEKEFIRIEHTSNLPGVKIAVQPFLVITQNDYILLDAGLGFDYNGEPVIYQSLKKENILPQQITKVLISHLHKDHIGGILHFTNGNFKDNFPNAEIYVQQRELDFALKQRGSLRYNFDVLDKLSSLPNLVMLSQDKGKISDEISYEVSGGHTPFHQEFWIEANGQIIFYGADNLPKYHYLQSQLAFKNDYDGKKAMYLRQKWKNNAGKEQWITLFYHDMDMPIY